MKFNHKVSFKLYSSMNLFKIIPLFLLNLLISCKKFVEIGPPKTEVASSTVFNNDATATSVMTGVYSKMMSGSGFAGGGSFSITVLSGLSADELISYSQSNQQFYENSISPTNLNLSEFLWTEPYNYIYTVNSILEGLEKYSGVTQATKLQLTGEAKFIRAFCYFYLSNLFGDVPLHLTTDYRTNSFAARIPKAQIYQQIIADLKDAQNLLKNDYSVSNGERVRPNKWAATALLARTYLYTGDWSNAETQSSLLINNTTLFSLESNLDNVFLSTSKEAIWQLMPVIPELNTWEGLTFILTTPPSSVSLSNQVANSFEAGDSRKISWIDSTLSGGQTYYYPYKYKIQTGSTLTEYSMVFRLAEQFLIRAEARTQQNNISGAQTDLNVIRSRAGLLNTTANDKDSLLSAILHERYVEYFAEWGHRWFDLTRTNTANSILSVIKGSNWQSTDQLYPVPLAEIQNNPNITQNSGY